MASIPGSSGMSRSASEDANCKFPKQRTHACSEGQQVSLEHADLG